MTQWAGFEKRDKVGRLFVQCRPVAHVAKPCGEDLLFAMFPLEANTPLVVIVAQVRGVRKNLECEIKLMFVDVSEECAFQRSHRDEEEWVELLVEFHRHCKYIQLKR